MKSDNSIFNTLNSICFGKATRSEINYIIELSHNYACTYLKYRYKNLNKVLLAEDVTIKELAIDAIAPMFERDENELFIKLIKAFNNWNPKIESEEQALFFLNRIVAKSTEKYVSNLLRDSDPFFSKILDSINYLIEKNGYAKKQILGTTYIVENKSSNGKWSNGDCNVGVKNLPDHNFIDELPIIVFNSKQNVVSKIFEFIKTETDKIPAIPLNALVIKLKQVNASSYIYKDSITENVTEINSIVEKAVKNTFSKLQESYIEKNKIEKSDGELIKKAIDKIVVDMQDGGINVGLHKYLMEQMTNLSFDEYKNKYQNTFEYLYKILKKEIAEELE
ncbi:MAG: hypothetical protein ROY99_14655 [Ignavibacterium sp.]|jgi:predicted transcriptional regulator|nr:hypothetical protein [Ignavibacterium sp.]